MNIAEEAKNSSSRATIDLEVRVTSLSSRLSKMEDDLDNRITNVSCQLDLFLTNRDKKQKAFRSLVVCNSKDFIINIYIFFLIINYFLPLKYLNKIDS